MIKPVKLTISAHGLWGNPYRDYAVTLIRCEDNTHGRRYHVKVKGKIIGRIERDEATFERKSAGNRFVNARWSSLRWFGVLGEYRKQYDFPRETRAGAAKEVVEAWLREKQKQKQDA